MATTTAGVGLEARSAALDVEEALRSHVGTEAGLGEEEVARVDPDEVADDGRVAVGDVAERSGVDDDGGVLDRLEQVRLERLAHDDGHGARTLQVLGGHRLAVVGVADDDAAEAGAHVVERGRQRQDRHHLRGGGDVEAGLAGDAVELRPEADHDVAQRPVVHVEHAPPGDVVQVDA